MGMLENESLSKCVSCSEYLRDFVKSAILKSTGFMLLIREGVIKSTYYLVSTSLVFKRKIQRKYFMILQYFGRFVSLQLNHLTTFILFPKRQKESIYIRGRRSIDNLLLHFYTVRQKTIGV